MVSVWEYEVTFAVRALFVKMETYVPTSGVVSEVEIIKSKTVENLFKLFGGK